MVSLPDSTSSIDQSTGHDDELEFHSSPKQRFTLSEDQIVDCVECEGENEFIEKNNPIVIEILSDWESEKLDEKTERSTMAMDSPMKKSIAENFEVPKIGESKGGEKAHKNSDGKGRPDIAKNDEEIDKFKYVTFADLTRGKGKKEFGEGKEKNVRGEEVVGNARTKNGLFMDLLEVLKMAKAVVGDADSKCKEDVDFLEMATRRGLSFPKPRWWPLNGFQE
ncbi:Hypothetical predicted protein [Olea europaea subsp. europaea]|uniref:Uncharacterized protein n=1 Tax=Olea europaea subsp. europaea TaxID=158383 RepID=A0A8S0R587_OLEEU|nr:Hypothetical predicted protein [Olea europaea subsp. europaea]